MVGNVFIANMVWLFIAKILVVNVICWVTKLKLKKHF